LVEPAQALTQGEAGAEDAVDHGAHDGVADALIAELQRQVRLLDLEVPAAPEYPVSPSPEIWQRHGAQPHSRQTLIVTLRGRSEEELWRGLSDSTRRQVKKARKNEALHLT